MARIHYSLSGEGRGHAARARVLVHLLKDRHEVVLHAYGAALEILKPLQNEGVAEVRTIAGLRFSYDRQGTLDQAGSVWKALPFIGRLPIHAVQLGRTLEKEKADLVISDFEPLLPRAAALANIPVMSVDHQQFLTCYDLSGLPPQLQNRARFLSRFVELYYTALRQSVISAFFFPKVKKRRVPITQAGVLLRREILEAVPCLGDHLVAYVRRNAPHRVLDALATCGRRVHVYGHGSSGTSGNLCFRSIDTRTFTDDLAASAALICTAGNQLVGEALYLRKPVLAYPEPGNFEQQINAYFLSQSGQGMSCEAKDFSGSLVNTFITSIPRFQERIRPERLNGNRLTLQAVENELAKTLCPERPRMTQLARPPLITKQP